MPRHYSIANVSDKLSRYCFYSAVGVLHHISIATSFVKKTRPPTAAVACGESFSLFANNGRGSNDLTSSCGNSNTDVTAIATNNNNNNNHIAEVCKKTEELHPLYSSGVLPERRASAPVFNSVPVRLTYCQVKVAQLACGENFYMIVTQAGRVCVEGLPNVFAFLILWFRGNKCREQQNQFCIQHYV